jgi:phosphoketolase
MHNQKHTEETKNILKGKTHDYFNENENIKKHREIMAKAKGIRVLQYDLNNNLLNEFMSIKDASRQTGLSASLIGKVIRNNTFKAGNFIWHVK